MPSIGEHYTDKERWRLLVRPGLTGLWQVSGDRAVLIHKNIEHNLYYSTFMDVAVSMYTFIFAMRWIYLRADAEHLK
jgi:lipopolysaccharide/colanic/teichoic acid biosynthesis glycosyltransferase